MSKIFIRDSLKQGKDLKAKKKNRKRSKYMNFRLSPEEAIVLDNKIKMSGLLKQDYIYQALNNHEVRTVGNIKSFTAIKEILYKILEKITDESSNILMDENDIETLKAVVKRIEGLKKNDEF